MDLKEKFYVKFKNGIIRKCSETKDKYICEDFSWYKFDTHRIVEKMSLNIIDLIEVGDIVTGPDGHKFEVYAIGSDCVYINNLEEFILIDDIKSIATKKEFSQIEYRLDECDIKDKE